MNAGQQIAWDCENAAVVIGNEHEYQLVPLDGPIDWALATAKARGYDFVGVIGLRGGKTVFAPEPGMDARMMRAVPDFFQYVKTRLARYEPKGDGVAWLESLWTLPDARSERA
jgi:hypothetical protein